jgi:hypothetical protein
MKTNQIDVVTFTMFSHFEQIEHAQETGSRANSGVISESPISG